MFSCSLIPKTQNQNKNNTKFRVDVTVSPVKLAMNYGRSCYCCYDIVRVIFLSLFYTVAYTKENSKGFVGGESTSPSSRGAWPKIEWFYIPAGLGFALIGFLQLKHILKREQKHRNRSSNTITTALSTDEENLEVDNRAGFVFTKWQVCYCFCFPSTVVFVLTLQFYTRGSDLNKIFKN